MFVNRSARGTVRASLVFLAAAALVGTATACGDDGGDGPDSAKIVGLIEIKGDSANALNDYNNGVTMGVDKVNAGGGVLGKPMSYDRIPASVTDPQAARTAFLKATDSNPSAIVGFPGGGSLEALTRDIDAAGVPMIHLSSDGKLVRGADAGSEWLFSINPDDDARATNAVALAQQLKGRRVGIIATDETFGRVSTENSIKAIRDAGLQPGDVRYVPPTTTDLTGAILDMRDTDVILSWTFPNVLALQLNQMAQNGMTQPVIGGNSAPLVVANNLVEGPARDPLYGVTPCAPALDEKNQTGVKFAADYKARFGADPTPSATQAYDSVRLLAAAMDAAGTTSDHAKIAEELRTIEWADGACAPVYQSDGAQFLGHSMVAEAAAGSGSIVASYTVPPRTAE